MPLVSRLPPMLSSPPTRASPTPRASPPPRVLNLTTKVISHLPNSVTTMRNLVILSYSAKFALVSTVTNKSPAIFQRDCFKNSSHFQYNMPYSNPSRSATTTAKGSSSTFSTEGFSCSHIKDIVQQFLAFSGNPHPTTLSVTLANSSWFFDSTYCNHMTPDSSLFSTKDSSSRTLAIQTADAPHIC